MSFSEWADNGVFDSGWATLDAVGLAAWDEFVGGDRHIQEIFFTFLVMSKKDGLATFFAYDQGHTFSSSHNRDF